MSDRPLQEGCADPRLVAARAALAQGDFPRAEDLLRERLAQAPDDAAALFMLAGLATRVGRLQDAHALLERCLDSAPGFDAARLEYARLLHRGGRSVEALLQLERLLARDPRNPAYRNLKAVALARTGDYAAAVPLYEGVLSEYPAEAGVWSSLGHALRNTGRAGEAIAAYRRCLDIAPDSGDAWWGLANLKTFRFDDADIAAMRAGLEKAAPAGDDRLQLSFALGKALEDRAEYDAAFENYARGNALRRRWTPYSSDANSAMLQRAAAIYTAEMFREREGQGCSDPAPIFVVGMPRSGSTLVEQILASHPLVEGTMELEEMTSIARTLRDLAGPALARPPGGYHEAVPLMDADALRAAGERYIERTRVHRKAGAPFFIDKMPNNFAHAGLIRLALPNAKIVDVRRHPMACGFSLFKQHFAIGQDFSYDLVDIGRYYRDYVDYMAHFDRVQPGAILRVAYEALVDDTETQVRRLLDYCGLPFDAACLRFFENDRPVRTASSEQVRQPIYREGLDHWRHFEPWLAPLREALGPVADPAA